MAQATDLRILAAIALEILSKISEQRSLPVVQVCGPIATGGFDTVEKNLMVFGIGIRILNAHGHNVFDQTIFQNDILRITQHNPDDGEYKTEILDDFFTKIFRSGHITAGYFLPGWKSSTGSVWEYELLTSLGIPCHEMPKDWFHGVFVH
ncbi:MAG: hypothetical protein JKX80_01345 [Candidatus Pacebacteria bacterium]|nr:hypothetical protein [Candidatus Paceibacterota bacterium]